uniref:Putative secreted protein n=1 Tax=Psorophora albipes TaxID=869069 RepID=T1DG19_9DIPT
MTPTAQHLLTSAAAAAALNPTGLSMTHPSHPHHQQLQQQMMQQSYYHHAAAALQQQDEGAFSLFDQHLRRQRW